MKLSDVYAPLIGQIDLASEFRRNSQLFAVDLRVRLKDLRCVISLTLPVTLRLHIQQEAGSAPAMPSISTAVLFKCYACTG